MLDPGVRAENLVHGSEQQSCPFVPGHGKFTAAFDDVFAGNGTRTVTYQVIIAPTAARQPHDRLPEAVAWACFEFIRGPLSEEPRKVGAPLRKPFEGQWRARRGEYRIRYAIDEDASIIHILDIDHRRDAYRS